ncbi:MAG: GNAT family N-acetyltransferase [Candidatus Omnitrophica bacterium]|nr:GNAT family N-acetyltransferase [Candidatus Omnitrophota bacterium]
MNGAHNEEDAAKRLIDQIICRQADIEEIIELREQVIIRGTHRDTPYFDGDRGKNTLHFGAFHGTKNIGCLTFILNEWQGRPAWQLRGMASDPDYRAMGVGARLLKFAESALKEQSNVRRLWCNARSSAMRFYEKQGWTTASDEFIIAHIGPHFKMIKILDE